MSKIDKAEVIMSIHPYMNRYRPEESEYRYMFVEMNEDGIKFWAEGRTKQFRIKLSVKDELHLCDKLIAHIHKLAGEER